MRPSPTASDSRTLRTLRPGQELPEKKKKERREKGFGGVVRSHIGFGWVLYGFIRGSPAQSLRSVGRAGLFFLRHLGYLKCVASETYTYIYRTRSKGALNSKPLGKCSKSRVGVVDCRKARLAKALGLGCILVLLRVHRLRLAARGKGRLGIMLAG